MSKLVAKKPKDVKTGHCKGLLYGRPGSGKTWFSLNFPSVYFIDSEGGADLVHYQKKLETSGGVYMGQEEGSCDFDTIIEQVKALATEKHPYKTLVIDSITKVFQSSLADEQERLGSKDVFGASKKTPTTKMRRLLNWIDKLDMNVWMTAFEVSRWEVVGGDRKEVGASPDIILPAIHDLDLSLRIQHVNKGYRIAVIDKTRLSGFPEFDRFVLQEGDKDLGYQEFSARYGKDYIEATPTQIVLATKEQVSELTRLTDLLKIDEAEIEKILAKSGAETYSELTQERAEKFIKWLNDKIKPETK